jgi:hypothetical protein
MADLSLEMKVYESMKESLESNYSGKWVLIHGNELIEIYDKFEDAAEDAVNKFGNGPYLIRQVGAIQTFLPSSMLFQLINA